MTETFSDRTLETLVVTRIDKYEDSYSISTQGSWGFIAPLSDAVKALQIGDVIQLETKGFNTIGGLKIKGKWAFHRSDEHFAEQDRKFMEKFEQDKKDLLEANRKDWAWRTIALPQWLWNRIAKFRENGKERFELEGWGYELIICELAAIYERNGGIDDDEINDFSRREGTSGNQHNVAKMLVKFKSEDLVVPAGLAPLTGDKDYSGK